MLKPTFFAFFLAVCVFFMTDVAYVSATTPEMNAPKVIMPEFKPRTTTDFTPRDGIRNTLKKLQNGEELRVAYLGGSITETGDGWRPQTTRMLAETWPTAKIHEIHAAIGASGSEIGVYRLKRDVLNHQPDLLFVEFAVNDGGYSPENIWKQFEGIIRQTWCANPETDIIFCYTLSGHMIEGYRAGTNPQTVDAMEQIADFYGIPSINFGPEVVRLMDAGKLLHQGKSAPVGVIHFSTDGLHPIASGSAIYVQEVKKAFLAMQDLEKNLQKNPQPTTHAPKLARTFISGNLENVTMTPIHPDMLHGQWRKLENGERYAGYNRWMDQVWETTTPGSRIEFKFRGTHAKMYDIPATNGGQIWVTVDGIKRGPFPRIHPFWWSRPYAFPIAENCDPKVTHTVIIELDSGVPEKTTDPTLSPSVYEGIRYLVGQIMLDGEIVKE
ncbi:MAG: GDSL-type esterase/lipase family protein [Planctomycetia bacterium]|nr:GDSL-type esterase/lipase family protein [Planctomycetia bacterium]